MSQYTDIGGGVFQANWATPARPGISFRFRKWRIEPTLSREMPEEELIEYDGRWLTPEAFADELADELKEKR